MRVTLMLSCTLVALSALVLIGVAGFSGEAPAGARIGISLFAAVVLLIGVASIANIERITIEKRFQQKLHFVRR